MTPTNKGRLEGIDLACRPIFQAVLDKVRTGRYDLVSESEVDEEAFQRAICTVTGQDACALTFVSVQEFVDARPIWMTPMTWRSAFLTSLGGDIKSYLEERYSALVRQGICRDNCLDHMISQVRLSVLGDLCDAIRESFIAIFGDNLCYRIQESISFTLAYLMGAAQSKSVEADRIFQETRDLALFLTQAIPVGELKDKYGTWIVLVA